MCSCFGPSCKHKVYAFKKPQVCEGYCFMMYFSTSGSSVFIALNNTQTLVEREGTGLGFGSICNLWVCYSGWVNMFQSLLIKLCSSRRPKLRTASQTINSSLHSLEKQQEKLWLCLSAVCKKKQVSQGGDGKRLYSTPDWKQGPSLATPPFQVCWLNALTSIHLSLAP